MQNATDLSVVIPAYDEEARLGDTLERILGYLEAREGSFEVLVVDDGSGDATVQVSESFADRGVRTLALPQNRGKGAALRHGTLESRGAWVLLTDADLSTPIEDLARLEDLAPDNDLVLGSRALAESQITLHQPRSRELMGRIFNWIIRLLGLSAMRDTQCGFKLIRGSVARELFERATVERFAYDVELIWLAERGGYRVAEVGVTWHDSPDSRVHALRDSSRMLWDILRLRWRHR
jgi:dolichyl-phosphate beta-glucosyltransferase